MSVSYYWAPNDSKKGIKNKHVEPRWCPLPPFVAHPLTAHHYPLSTSPPSPLAPSTNHPVVSRAVNYTVLIDKVSIYPSIRLPGRLSTH